ncbi:3-galactosyl-N-acetylglucosaminide 4-alpha-L-fucosyltransferase FUT3-like [Lytechinus variegatus]|uniref:3-galactosyl-N-acetylglucosaminide 4-alpha-L-fucosyltransferase FUT3-like n=1 Tax=Lytechinus variegatus TaxID=7654 RepID=UPI001BB2C010|nr:3-galactosyl-N-acetylglucosaminide 4-alpha-L-fucosyltransferase FUT3-like [Lytechinus variegatus]
MTGRRTQSLIYHPSVIPASVIFVTTWMILVLVIEYQYLDDTEQLGTLVMIEEDEKLIRKRKPFPCHLSGTCELQDYIRDGRHSRPGQIGASRTSWKIPLLWKNNGPVSYTQGCYRQVHIWSEGRRNEQNYSCPGIPCGIRLVHGTSLKTMQESDAVLLHHQTEWDWDIMYSHRPHNQKWIFYSLESPLNTGSWVIPPLDRYSNTYDYIMTYRKDFSQLYGTYGLYDTSAPSAGVIEGKNWAFGKTDKVVWLASNCFDEHWKRYDFVSLLSHHILVKIYGKCGDTSACTKIANSDLCSETLRKYKFYLALENSPCRYYISEKLWNNAYLNDLIPIVFGPPRKDYEAVAPPNSFIHVEDFTSIKDLALYLHKLDQNDHLYNQYFEWKTEGFVVATKESWLLQPRQMCQIVDRLLVDEEAKENETYHSMMSLDWKTWWKGSCRDVDLPIDAG